MPKIRLAISIEDMGDKIDRDYRSSTVGSRGEELKYLEGLELNPKYSQHLRDMVQFHSLKKFMDINDPRFDYTDEQKSGLDPTFSSADLVCAQCLQTSAPMPKGEFSEDAMKISNMYMQIFGDPPGRCVSDVVHSRATYLDGLRDLYQMANLTGDKLIVALHFQKYYGPVASEPFEDALLVHRLDPGFEKRLRQENWALPSQPDKPMAILMVIQAFRGPPVVFKLSDFARFDPIQRKYRMEFPEEFTKFLMRCAVVIMYDRPVAVELLADTYGTEHTAPEFKGHLHPLKILDVARLNSTSV
ncbi:MAG: hypothetical protein GY821_02810, partial [Gammaproteobacteria bacterium]|nr:hypothetical protein [Gammaproteobacteria bacterium]